MKNLDRPFLLCLTTLCALTCFVSCDVVFHLNDLASFCQILEQAEIKAPTDEGDTLVFELPGVLAVHEGFACAESRRDGKEDIIKVQERFPLPFYASSATVFLSGWKVKYLSKDHHVGGIATFIQNIAIDKQTLTWEAIGALGDHNFDDSYEWCYHYTVIAWNPTSVALMIDQEDADCDTDPADTTAAAQSNLFIADNEGGGSLSAFRSFLQNPEFASGSSVAILPRGFGYIFSGDDHHLLQIAEHADNSEVIVEGGAEYRKLFGKIIPAPASPGQAIVSRVNAGFVSWETFAVMKDNSSPDYHFGNTVSGMGGRDVELIQPPFAVLPQDDIGIFGASVGSSGAPSRQFVVESLPFEIAIPVLSSWDIAYDDDDEHVTEAGIWIDDIHYDKNPAAATGTLRYSLSSVLRDKDSSPKHFARHKVTILGIRPLGSNVTDKDRKADLVPFSPLGESPAAYCRFEEEKKLLRVTVLNQGPGEAGPSQTSVSFSAGTFPMNTPGIPAGHTADLLFKVPNDCFSPDCAFRIIVDASRQVDEGDGEGNNTASGGGCTN